MWLIILLLISFLHQCYLGGLSLESKLQQVSSSFLHVLIQVKNAWLQFLKGLKLMLKWWTIGKSGERGLGISVLVARHDDDDDDKQKYGQ